MKQLTLDTILQLRNLVLEKDARLAAISNRFDVLAGLVKTAKSEDELDIYAAEVKELGAEVEELIAFKKSARKKIDKFFACPIK